MQDDSPGPRNSFIAKIPSWLDKRLDKIEKDKSDRAVVKAEFKRVDGDIEDLKTKISKGHQCLREGDIRTMESSIAANKKGIRENTETIRGVAQSSVEESKRVYRWYIRGLIGLILFLLTTGGGFVWYLAGVAFHLERHTEQIQKLEAGAEKPAAAVPTEKMLEDLATRTAQKTAERFKNSGTP